MYTCICLLYTHTFIHMYYIYSLIYVYIFVLGDTAVCIHMHLPCHTRLWWGWCERGRDMPAPLPRCGQWSSCGTCCGCPDSHGNCETQAPHGPGPGPGLLPTVFWVWWESLASLTVLVVPSFLAWRRQWHPTPVLLENPMDGGAW